MPVIKLTQQLLAAGLTCPGDKTRVEYCDTELPGFYAEVRQHGHPTFYLRYKDNTGKTCHQKIGRACDIDLVDAKKQAKTLKAEIALGAKRRNAFKNPPVNQSKPPISATKKA